MTNRIENGILRKFNAQCSGNFYYSQLFHARLKKNLIKMNCEHDCEIKMEWKGVLTCELSIKEKENCELSTTDFPHTNPLCFDSFTQVYFCSCWNTNNYNCLGQKRR